MLILTLKKLPKNLTFHKPVLLQSACHFLAVKPGGLYIDATLGGGSHAAEIIRLGGKVLGLDQDPEAISACPDLDQLTKVHANFIHLAEVARQYHWSPVSGILFDLGISSHQVDTASRGFSFQKSGLLDMRMDPGLPHTAATLVNQLSVNQLASLFKDFGEIPMAKPLAVKIVAARPLATTEQLAAVTGKWSRQAFQALRIAVNDELGAIQTVLPQAHQLLASAGRLVVISFHSLEDRLVKHQFAAWQQAGQGRVITPDPVGPDLAEITANSRSKSAKLRAYEKN